MDIVILVVAGAAGGFVAGLVGVGGGIIFGPVLFFYFQGLGIQDPILTPLTLGTSLLCTFFAALSGAIAQHRRKAVDWRTAWISGCFAAATVTVLTLFVTTRPLYSKEAFQVVLGVVLVAVVAQMLMKTDKQGSTLSTEGARRKPGFLALIGAGAGSIAAAAGVGGGVIMVPAFNSLVRLPLKVSSGTSTTAITLISLTGVLVYALSGLDADVPATAVGFVDMRNALLLGVPAIVTASLGVSVAHRVTARWVRYSFAIFAGTVAAKLIWSALG